MPDDALRHAPHCHDPALGPPPPIIPDALRRKTCVVIPTKNEDTTLAGVLERVQLLGLDVLVADGQPLHLGGLLLVAPCLLTLFEYSLLMEHAHAVGHVTIDWIYLPGLVLPYLPYLHGWTTNLFGFHDFPNQLNVAFVGPLALFALVYWLGHRKRFPDPATSTALTRIEGIWIRRGWPAGRGGARYGSGDGSSRGPARWSGRTLGRPHRAVAEVRPAGGASLVSRRDADGGAAVGGRGPAARKSGREGVPILR